MKTKPGVYQPIGLDGYELCHPLRQEDFETINVVISGAVRQSNWVPIQMEIIREDEAQRLVGSDSPWLGAHALIFRADVIERMGPMLQDGGELLPLACSEAQLLILQSGSRDRRAR